MGRAQSADKGTSYSGEGAARPLLHGANFYKHRAILEQTPPGAIPEADQVDRISTNQEQFQESGNTVAKNDHDPPDHLIVIGGYPRIGEG